MPTIHLSREHGDFGFVATDEQGHTIKMDSSPESGGQNFGVRPMQTLLMGLAGCSGIDMISILKKQRQDVKRFHISLEGERHAGTEPSLWKNVTIVFELGGEIDKEKAEKACALSINKYCSVAETLRQGNTEISWKVVVNGQ